MSDELERPDSKPESAPESTETTGRAGLSGRKNRRGRSNRNRQEAPSDPAFHPEHAHSEHSEVQSATMSRPELRGPEPRRSRNQGFGDGIDHQICPRCLPNLPATYPVHGRQGLAIAPLQTVAESIGVRLLCDQLHAGECLWPDLTPLDPVAAVSRNWMFVVQSGMEWFETDADRASTDPDSGS